MLAGDDLDVEQRGAAQDDHQGVPNAPGELDSREVELGLSPPLRLEPRRAEEDLNCNRGLT